jgi:hypothetical protein
LVGIGFRRKRFADRGLGPLAETLLPERAPSENLRALHWKKNPKLFCASGREFH